MDGASAGTLMAKKCRLDGLASVTTCLMRLSNLKILTDLIFPFDTTTSPLFHVSVVLILLLLL